MRRLLAFVCFSALLALLVLGALPGSAAEQVTLRWTVWAGSPEELNIYQLQAKEFQAKNPGIKVILESGPFANYWDKQQAAFASNTAADVMELSHAFWPSLKTKGVLLDLLPIIRKTGYDLDGFYPQLLDNFYYNGGLYGFPVNASTCALYYNKTLFDKAGIPYPDKTWTWDTFLGAAKKLTKYDASGRAVQWGASIGKSSGFALWNPILVFLWQNGADMLNDDYTEFVMNSPEAVEALQFLVDLRLKHRVAPTPFEEADLGNLFMSGRVAMEVNHRAMVPAYKQITTFEWDVAHLPYKKERATTLGAPCFCISAKTKHPEEAFKLLSYIVGEGQRFNMSLGNSIPTRKDPALLELNLVPPPENGVVFIDAVEYGHKVPYNPVWSEMDGIMTKALDLVWLGRKSVQDAMNEIKPQIDRLLKSVAK